jgi:mono/diheme cytochrome c family protein
VTTPRLARTVAVAAGVTWLLALGWAARGVRAQAPPGSDGWQIPAGAGAEINPIAPTPEVLAKGHDLFGAKCRRCHGATGTGNGPDADPDHPPGNLTDARRASRNPDGVMFYKIWNGRSKPKMPAFKTDLTRGEVWTVIQYVKTLRR